MSLEPDWCPCSIIWSRWLVVGSESDTIIYIWKERGMPGRERWFTNRIIVTQMHGCVPERDVNNSITWVFEWGPECEEMLSKSFLWEKNPTFDVFNLRIRTNLEEILVSHIMPDQLSYHKNFVPFLIIGKDYCIMHMEFEYCFVRSVLFLFRTVLLLFYGRQTI